MFCIGSLLNRCRSPLGCYKKILLSDPHDLDILIEYDLENSTLIIIIIKLDYHDDLWLLMNSFNGNIKRVI